jgi:hypothetical protein
MATGITSLLRDIIVSLHYQLHTVCKGYAQSEMAYLLTGLPIEFATACCRLLQHSSLWLIASPRRLGLA